MPKLIYSISKFKAAREKNRLTASNESARDGYNSLVMLGEHKAIKKPFMVFEFLENALSEKPLGSRATYAEGSERGSQVGYVYEKASNNYFLIEKRCFPAGGGAPKVERLPVPKKFQQR